MFEEIDVDGDGLIDRAEFRTAISVLAWGGDPPSAREVDAYFDAIDVDGGGEIDATEFHNFLTFEAKALEVEPAAMPVVKPKTAPRTPDMLSLSASLAALAKFIFFDMTNYLQINSSLTSSIDVQWPPIFGEVSGAVNQFLNLAFLTNLGSLNCSLQISYCYQVLMIMIFFLSVLAGQPTFMYFVRNLPKLTPARFRHKTTSSEERIGEAMDRSVHANVILMMVVHGPLSKFLIGLLACRQYNDLSVLGKSMNIECGSDNLCMSTAGVFLMLYTLGIPGAIAYNLYIFMSPSGHKKHDGTTMGKHMAKRMGFLVGKYESAFFFYECLELIRKFLLMVVSEFFPYGTYTKLVTNLLIGLFFFILLVRFCPYKSPMLDVVVLTSHFCTCATLFWALIDKAGYFTEAGISPYVSETILLLITFLPLFVSVGIISIAMREVCTYQAHQLNVKRLKMQVTMQEFKKTKFDKKAVTLNNKGEQLHKKAAALAEKSHRESSASTTKDA